LGRSALYGYREDHDLVIDTSTSTADPIDVDRVRRDFPILQQEHHSGTPLVYLDNAATSQKPNLVIDGISDYYRTINANVHRGVHKLSELATERYEGVRNQVRDFIHAESRREVVFTRGCTEGINLVAQAWGRSHLQQGDTVLLTVMEHHSNIVPWQILSEQIGFAIRYVPLLDDLTLDIEAYEAILSQHRVKLVALMHVSNVLGTKNPLRQIAALAHSHGAIVLVDGAQGVPHLPVNVRDLEVDFYAFSGHKMLGPTGIGVLYARREHLDEMTPWQGGGEMIAQVTLERSIWADVPHKFEAGTPSIAEVIGLGYAIDYLGQLGMDRIASRTNRLAALAIEGLRTVPRVTVYAPPAQEVGSVATFMVEGLHAHDVAYFLDDIGIAVRAGHHCAMPLHTVLGLTATARASFYFYNTEEEVEALIEGVRQLAGKLSS
jgi:cysteine desulfurase / selenocysteine lyase